MREKEGSRVCRVRREHGRGRWIDIWFSVQACFWKAACHFYKHRINTVWLSRTWFNFLFHEMQVLNWVPTSFKRQRLHDSQIPRWNLICNSCMLSLPCVWACLVISSPCAGHGGPYYPRLVSVSLSPDLANFNTTIILQVLVAHVYCICNIYIFSVLPWLSFSPCKAKQNKIKTLQKKTYFFSL